MSARPVLNQLQSLRPEDPLYLLLQSASRQIRTIGIWFEAENRVYPVRVVVNAAERNSEIPETLVARLNLQCLVTTPSMPPGNFARVPVRDAIESCGIPDMLFNVRVTRARREEVVFLGRNALERAARVRAG